MPIEFKEAPPEWNLGQTPQVAIVETRPSGPVWTQASLTNVLQPPAFRVNYYNVNHLQYRVQVDEASALTQEMANQGAQAHMRAQAMQQYANTNATTGLALGDMTGLLNSQATTATVYYQQQQLQNSGTNTIDYQYNYVTVVPQAGLDQGQWYLQSQQGMNGVLNNTVFNNVPNPYYTPDTKKMVREFMKTRWQIRSGSKALPGSISPQEQKARDCLRDMISEADWRRYVTNGFIMVKGSRGWYQIFASKYERIRFFQNNKHLHNLCVHTDDSCPPSDHVVNMKIMVECNEDALWSGEANVHAPVKSSLREQLFNPPTEQISLVKTFKMYKNAA